MDATAKVDLRRSMRDARRRVAADAVGRAERSERIWGEVVARLGLDQRAPASRKVMLFESLAGEPDTSSWIAWCAARGLDVFLPAVDGPHLRVLPGDLDPLELDVVVVPGLAFTADGHRLGQGGGHYDRFLSRLRPDCVTVGVGFSEQLIDAVPFEPHDVRVHHVVTG